MMDKIFHHKKEEEKSHSSEQEATEASESGKKSGFKDEEQKFKDYMKKDEELEQEGKEYGGLM